MLSAAQRLDLKVAEHSQGGGGRDVCVMLKSVFKAVVPDCGEEIHLRK